jgi:hypothetical protein
MAIGISQALKHGCFRHRTVLRFDVACNRGSLRLRRCRTHLNGVSRGSDFTGKAGKLAEAGGSSAQKAYRWRLRGVLDSSNIAGIDE